MTKITHSCVPNTSAIFNGSYLQLFYLPSKQLKVESGNSCFKNVYYDPTTFTVYHPKLAQNNSLSSFYQYLPLKNSYLESFDGLSFDFQYDLFTKVDSTNLYILNKIRMIECYCKQCTQTKLVDLHENFDEDKDKSCFNMDENDSLLEIDYQAESQINYGNCLNIIDQLNAQYGNYLDNEYSLKIQVPVNELIKRYRELLGYYHPRISILLLFLLYSNLILVRDEKEDYLIFYRYKLLHNYILQIIEAVSLTIV